MSLRHFSGGLPRPGSHAEHHRHHQSFSAAATTKVTIPDQRTTRGTHPCRPKVFRSPATTSFSKEDSYPRFLDCFIRTRTRIVANSVRRTPQNKCINPDRSVGSRSSAPDKMQSLPSSPQMMIVRGTATLRSVSMNDPPPPPLSPPYASAPDPHHTQTFTQRSAGSRIIYAPTMPQSQALPENQTKQQALSTPQMLSKVQGRDVVDLAQLSTAVLPSVQLEFSSVPVTRVSGPRSGTLTSSKDRPGASSTRGNHSARFLTEPDMLKTSRPTCMPRQRTYTHDQENNDLNNSSRIVSSALLYPSPSLLHGKHTTRPKEIRCSTTAANTGSALEKRRPARWSLATTDSIDLNLVSQRRDKTEARCLASACISLEHEILSIETHAKMTATDTDGSAFMESKAQALRNILAGLEDRYDSIQAFYLKGREYAQAVGRFYQVSPDESELCTRGNRLSSQSSPINPSKSTAVRNQLIQLSKSSIPRDGVFAEHILLRPSDAT